MQNGRFKNMKFANMYLDCCKTRGEWIARITSDFANPLTFPPLLFWASGWEFNASSSQILYLTGISVFFFTLLPLTLLIYLQRTSRIKSLDIINIKSRNLPFFFTLVSYMFGSIILLSINFEGSYIIKIIILCYLVNPVVGWLISQKWKISIHTAAIGTSIALFFMLYKVGYKMHGLVSTELLLFVFLLLLPAVMWARYRLGVHTLPQVAAGAIIGLVITYLQIMLMLNINYII